MSYLSGTDLAALPKSGGQMTGLYRDQVVATLASAATIDLSTAGTNAGMITALSGTASISTVTMTAGSKVAVICSGTPTLVNGANLVVEGNANYTCAVGDRLTFISFDGTKVYVFIKKADGTVVAAGTPNGVATLDASGILTAAQLGAASLTTNGYQKLPSGMIIQWGSTTVVNGGNIAVTFPIAYPNTVLAVVATAKNQSSAGSAQIIYATSYTATGFLLWVLDGTAQIFDAAWLAIGY